MEQERIDKIRMDNSNLEAKLVIVRQFEKQVAKCKKDRKKIEKEIKNKEKKIVPIRERHNLILAELYSVANQLVSAELDAHNLKMQIRPYRKRIEISDFD